MLMVHTFFLNNERYYALYGPYSRIRSYRDSSLNTSGPQVSVRIGRGSLANPHTIFTSALSAAAIPIEAYPISAAHHMGAVLNGESGSSYGFVGHCFRHASTPSPLALWTPSVGVEYRFAKTALLCSSTEALCLIAPRYQPVRIPMGRDRDGS